MGAGLPLDLLHLARRRARRDLPGRRSTAERRRRSGAEGPPRGSPSRATGGGSSSRRARSRGRPRSGAPAPTARAPAPVTHVNDGALARGRDGRGLRALRRGPPTGANLQAWLVKPPGFDPSKKYPAVFLIHGGPQGAWTDWLVVPLEPAGLGGLRLRRLRRQSARLDRLRPGVRRRDQPATGAGRSTTT